MKKESRGKAGLVSNLARKRRLRTALIIGGLVVAAYLVLHFVIMRDLLQSVDSPDVLHTARFFWLLDEGGPAPYGNEVRVSKSNNPLGRFGGDTFWIGYCAGGVLSWKSTTDIELTCPPHPDAKDVYFAGNRGSIHFRIVRQR